MRHLPTVAILLSLMTFASSTAAADSSRDSAFTFPFRLVDHRVFVEVELNGKGPFSFILDTGAGEVLSDSTALRLGLTVRSAGAEQGVGAATQAFGETRLDELRLGALLLTDVACSVTSFADAPQVFGTQPVDGIIGKSVFERMVVKHDYVHRILTFTPPHEYRAPTSSTIVPIRRPRQIPVIEATLDGVSGRFGVDTGARSALLLYGPFCDQNRLAAKYHARWEGVTGWGIGGPVRSLIARAHRLELGGASVRGPIVRLSTQKGGVTTSSDMAGLIGPDVLWQFDVTFDYAQMRMILEKSAHYGERDSYDRAGVWMGQSGPHFTAVDVIAGGPAYQAGLRAGDTILAIDERKTETLSLPQVREEMRRRPVGAKVSLLVESQGKRRTMVVILRDLA